MSEFPSNNSEDKRKNRKRKKSVLVNARKYAKQGKFGRGSHLDEDKYQYFVRVLELWRDGFETEEEKLIFVNNVFEETINEELNYSTNQIGCRVVEILLPFANNTVLDRFIVAFSTNLRIYSGDRFASHVLQCLLKITCKKSLTETEEDAKNKFRDFTLKVSKFLLNNLEDFIGHMYANHVIRTTFEVLANIPSNKENSNKTQVKEENKLASPEEYMDVVKEYGTRLISWPHFKDLPYNELSSGLLQILLLALKEIDLKLLKNIVKKLNNESFSPCTDNSNDGGQLPDVFASKPATILLETAIITATPKLFTQIYAKCFIGNLATLARMKGCNITVQKLIKFCNETIEFEAIFDELANIFEDILACGHTGVILALAETCKRLSSKQGNFVQSLMKALHCTEPRDRETSFVQTTIRLVPYERLDSFKTEHYFVNLHGSIILQIMLEFKKPIKIVQSLLNMEPSELQKLFCDSKGSHIIDSYVKSSTVGEKSREKLVYKMMGTYQEMAVSKYGSRSLEAFWSAANLKQKIKIMEELSYKDGLWINSEFGKIIGNKLQFTLFKRNKNEWCELMEKPKNNKNLFVDILGGNTNENV